MRRLFRLLLRCLLGLSLIPASIILLMMVEILQLHWYNAHPGVLHTKDGPVSLQLEMDILLSLPACLLVTTITLLYIVTCTRWVFKRKK